LSIAGEIFAEAPGEQEDPNDPRYEFSVGDIVFVVSAHEKNTNKIGDISEVITRRNGYPQPLFSGCWFPLYYLKQLNDRYEEWAAGYSMGKLLTINVDNLDFTENPEDLSSIIDRIDAQIHGLF